MRNLETISKQDGGKVTETEEQQDACKCVVPGAGVKVVNRNCEEPE